MLPSYKVSSTSNRSATVEDIWLNPPEDADSASTRKILRAEIVDNIHSSEARVKVCLLHQKRHSRRSPWEDVDAFNLATLKSGEEVRLQLDSAETYHLRNELDRLHTISQGGIPQGERNLVVADEDETVVVQGATREVIQQLLNEAGDDFWQTLQELQPNLFRAVALMKLHETRENAVQEFREHLEANDWREDDWQQFFKANTWIFGYGLSYQFLSTITDQPHYGGTDLSGSGGQRGDFLTSTEAEVRFTVLVEIKKPDTQLLLERLYRNKTHFLGGELVGGVSQVQSNCRTWEIEGSRTEENRELLGENAPCAIQPKGILIIGNTNQLDSVAKRATFELFRRNLQNPEIITFDELLSRAQYLLLNEEKQFIRNEAGE